MKPVGWSAATALLFLSAVCAFAENSLTPPFRFEVNQGQASADVKYVAIGPAYKADLSEEGITLPLTLCKLKLRFKGGETPSTQPLNDLNLISNYYPDRNVAYTGIRNYGRVLYKDVYPGIDVVFYGTAGKLEFDFIVAPGADIRAIDLAVTGHDKLQTDDEGSLILRTADGDITLSAPHVYQDGPSGRKVIDGRLVVKSANDIGFVASGYDTSRPLVIDPTLAFSTYTSNHQTELPSSIRYDDGGNVYVSFKGDRTTSFTYLRVQKISRDGTPGYITEFGFDELWWIGDLAVDSSRNAYGVGHTDQSSRRLPTKNAIHPDPPGGTGDGFAFKLSPTGDVLFMTYLGGPDYDEANSVYLDPLQTNFSVLLITAGQTFVTKMSVDGQTIMSSIPVSGTFSRLLIDTAGNIYVGGNSGGVVKLNAGGSVLWNWTGATSDFGFDKDGNVYILRLHTSSGAAFLDKLDSSGHLAASSGSLPGSFQNFQAIAVDSTGNIYIAGTTYSGTSGRPPAPVINSFRQQPGFDDLLVLKFSPDLKNYLLSTFLAGSMHQGMSGPTPGSLNRGTVIAVDGSNRLYVGGWTNSLDFPTTDGSQFPKTGADYAAVAFVLDPNIADTTARYTRLEEDYFAIQYSGAWFPNTSPNDSAGRSVLAMDTGSKASLSFTGSGKISWFGTRDAWMGIAKVSVDGTVAAMVDTYSAYTVWDTELWSTTLASGSHTITIEVTGTKNASSQGYWVWIDKFEITSAGDIAIGTASGGGGGGGVGGVHSFE